MTGELSQSLHKLISRAVMDDGRSIERTVFIFDQEMLCQDIYDKLDVIVQNISDSYFLIIRRSGIDKVELVCSSEITNIIRETIDKYWAFTIKIKYSGLTASFDEKPNNVHGGELRITVYGDFVQPMMILATRYAAQTECFSLVR